ncbi:MAG: DUF4349 domain-containing protein [Spirochaetales bacterium]|nr:DUF4349 domain-containing protein [Spirochaetales bacterium]
MNRYVLPALLMILASPLLFAEDSLYHEIQAQLLVKDRQTASERISDWAESQGGYFTVRSLDRLTLRIPDTELEELKTLLETESEEIVSYSQNAFDLRESILTSQSYLEAREELLARNLEYLDQSDLEGTLTLEMEIRRLMQEIDSLKGLLRKYENDRNYARVDLSISFKNNTLPEGRPSRFDWINSIDFSSFINSPLQISGGGRSPELPIPDGFALADRKPWFQLLSPEGVRLRLRDVENYPEQNKDFWTRALFAHMEGLGYIALDQEKTLSLDEGESFSIRSWGVPLGRKDYIYMTGIRLKGSRIEILEITGEAEYLRNYF